MASARNFGETLDPYIREVLLAEDSENAEKLIWKLEEVMDSVNSASPPLPEVAGKLQERARHCVQVIAGLEERRNQKGKKKQQERGGKKARTSSVEKEGAISDDN